MIIVSMIIRVIRVLILWLYYSRHELTPGLPVRDVPFPEHSHTARENSILIRNLEARTPLRHFGSHFGKPCGRPDRQSLDT